MNSRSCILFGIAFLVPLTVAAQDTAAPRPAPAGLSFLQPEHDYVIRFPDEKNIFKVTRSGTSSTYEKLPDGKKRYGKPATWTMTLSVEIFKVIRFGGGSWVLLEHPASPEDYAKWGGKRRAMAQLTPARVAALSADPDGKQQLQQLRDAAARDISTTKTWVNLDHAIAIADVPTDPADLKFTVKPVSVKD